MAHAPKRPVWIAPATVVDGVKGYGRPVRYDWNVRAMNSGAEMKAFGPSYMDYRKAVTVNSDVDNIKRLDRVWLDTTPSDHTDALASDADFYVDGILPNAAHLTEVIFRRLSRDAE